MVPSNSYTGNSLLSVKTYQDQKLFLLFSVKTNFLEENFQFSSRSFLFSWFYAWRADFVSVKSLVFCMKKMCKVSPLLRSLKLWFQIPLLAMFSTYFKALLITFQISRPKKNIFFWQKLRFNDKWALIFLKKFNFRNNWSKSFPSNSFITKIANYFRFP